MTFCKLNKLLLHFVPQPPVRCLENCFHLTDDVSFQFCGDMLQLLISLSAVALTVDGFINSPSLIVSLGHVKRMANGGLSLFKTLEL